MPRHVPIVDETLREDPWERIRHVRKLITRTPINAIVRGQSLWTFEVFPNDVVELAIERLKANGIAQLAVYDQFNDLQNVEVCVAKANEVYAAARVRFEFDPTPRTGDWVALNDTDVNNLAAELPGDPAWERAKSTANTLASHYPHQPDARPDG